MSVEDAGNREGEVEVAKILMDASHMRRTIVRIAHEVAENVESMEVLALVGIHRRGVEIAERLAAQLEETYGVRPDTGAIDITFYRDDVDTRSAKHGYQQPIVHSSKIPFDLQGRIVVLVDDVLYTGRTIRAAIDALMDYGRPKAVRLAVLVDRGHRELPIRADFVGKNIPTGQSERIRVQVRELDGTDLVTLERGRE